MTDNIIPPDSRYTPLTQQPYCCVPTCIQMIMLRHQIPLQPAELLGYHMGLVVPESDSKYFYHARTGQPWPSGYGTNISLPEYSPNAVFQKLHIPLTLSTKLIDQFPDIASFRAYLQLLSTTQSDTLICYDWPSLRDPDETDHWGHVCVLDRVFLDTDTIRFIDPSRSSPKWVTVTIPDLYQSMRTHGAANSAGFWELTPTNI